MTPIEVYVLVLSPIFAVALIAVPFGLAMRDMARSERKSHGKTKGRAASRLADQRPKPLIRHARHRAS